MEIFFEIRVIPVKQHIAVSLASLIFQKIFLDVVSSQPGLCRLPLTSNLSLFKLNLSDPERIQL